MAAITRRIARTPEACWRRFIDLDALSAWLPNLRRVRVITTGADGRPHEVAFELTSSSYTLVYAYDEATLTVRWAPRTGVRDAVRGEASFAAAPDGCLMTYQLEGSDARSTRALAEPDALVSAFARWMLQSA